MKRRRRPGSIQAEHVGAVDVAPAGTVTDAPAALTGRHTEPERPTWRVVLMRGRDLRPGDVVRRQPGERDEWHGDAWFTVRHYNTAEGLPPGATGPWVYTCDIAASAERLWEVQVPDEPPVLWWPIPRPVERPDPTMVLPGTHGGGRT